MNNWYPCACVQVVQLILVNLFHHLLFDRFQQTAVPHLQQLATSPASARIKISISLIFSFDYLETHIWTRALKKNGKIATKQKLTKEKNVLWFFVE